MGNFEKLIMILKETRLKKEYSFRQVEMYLNHKGVKYNFTSLKKLEDGKIKSVSPRVLHTLAEIYGLNAVELFKMADFLDKDYEIERVRFIDYKIIGVSSFEYVHLNDIQELYDTTELYNPQESETYVIKMKDQSMQGLEEKNIPDGSYLIVDADIPEDIRELCNEVCIFKFMDRFYVRELQIMNERVFLRSFNKKYADIMITDISDLKCEGRVKKCYYVKEYNRNITYP
jgi:SOS-response transcriptional repressor LexA